MTPNDEATQEVETEGEVASAPPPTTPPPLDFEKVEALRKHMILTIAQMAKVLGTSRVTYTNWTKGGPIRKSNDAKVREALRQLLQVMTVDEWPKPEHVAMASDQRFKALLELKSKYE